MQVIAREAPVGVQIRGTPGDGAVVHGPFTPSGVIWIGKKKVGADGFHGFRDSRCLRNWNRSTRGYSPPPRWVSTGGEVGATLVAGR